LLDYRLWYDNANNEWQVYQSNIQAASLIVTGLSQGNYYKFRVQSRNQYGYCGEHGFSSEFSEELVVLAAQIPDVPTAVSTEFIPQSTSPIEGF
jgi:hypothetical protein